MRRCLEACRRLRLIAGIMLCGFAGRAQPLSPPDTVVPGRVWTVAGAGIALYGGSLLLLNQYWYKNYPRSHFHFFNDGPEWYQMDKAGHAFTTYTLSRYATSVWEWTGMTPRKSAWIGTLTGFGYQTVVEILDGYSAQWGFSAEDMLANAAGGALLAAQQLTWGEQRIQLKFSAHTESYRRDPVLHRRAETLFGAPFMENILKDYNTQTYWLSVNLRACLPGSNLPPWLNLAFGYGGKNMFGGRDNIWTDDEGIHRDYSHLPRLRQFYVSPDIDFTKIHSRHKAVRVLLQVLNTIKIPAPALEITSKGKARFHPLYF
ncbi:DUF2279 domain-containing protein [Compostibacter hankyongensis]|uniref:DUF2279 domain-containing protein n=1 Tax=Compostibacter hankyongensis TaxID=1007089 RepID=A0ABP8FS18_9BACT